VSREGLPHFLRLYRLWGRHHAPASRPTDSLNGMHVSLYIDTKKVIIFITDLLNFQVSLKNCVPATMAHIQLIRQVRVIFQFSFYVAFGHCMFLFLCRHTLAYMETKIVKVMRTLCSCHICF